MINEFFKENQADIRSFVIEHDELFPFITDFIYKVTPNSIHQVIGWDIKKDLPVLQAFFFSDNRIAKLLYATDGPYYQPFGNKLLRFNSLTFNPATGERTGEISNNVTWAGARGAAASTADNAILEIQSQASGGHFWNWRMQQPFLTSSLGIGATVSASNWQGYRDDVQEILSNGFNNADSTSAEIVVSTEVDPTAYASTDYANVSFISKGTIAFNSMGANNTYSTITITDQTIISVSGYTKLAIITGRDLNNNAPTANNSYTIQNHSQANPPILTVTYTPAPGGLLLSDI